jgi:Protein of unknown function (DUF3617)
MENRMFGQPVFAKSILILIGLTSVSYVYAEVPATATSKPDGPAFQCALRQYIPWVRAQVRPLDPDLKAKKLQEIDEACGSSLHLSNVITSYDSPATATQEPKQPVTAVTPAAPAGPNLSAVARPLYEDLQKPEFFESRCMLAPLLASDKRTIAMSRDDTFRRGDRILRINRELLSATSDRALHDLLVRYPPDATMTVRVLRAETEVDVSAPCTDSKEYYALLRAAVTAAMQDDAATCADRMREAGKLHALASTWINVSLNCESKAGRIAAAHLLPEYFVMYHELLMENDYSPSALQKVRASLQEAAQKLLDAGSRPLAEKLQQEYALEVAKWSPLQGSALGLQLQPHSPVSSQTGIIQAPPNVTVTQNGKVTNLTVAGQLAAKNPVGCVPLETLYNTRTPPDLYLGVSACIQKDDYHAAAALFALAGIESRFDAARVLDKSAGQAGTVLIMNTFNGLPQDKRERFGKAVGDLAADPNAMTDTCRTIRKIGYPNYYPEYMVLHGINAFTAKPGDGTLVAGFDAPVTWNFLLTNYLSCHDVPTAPLSPRPQATATKDDVPSNDPNRMSPGLYQVQIDMGDLVPTEKNTGPTYMRMCFTPAMINASNPVPPQDQCDSYKVSHDGNTTHISFSCSKDGTKSTGRSDETINGNHRHSVIDMSTETQQGTHALHLVTDLIFLGPDCNATYAAPPVPISVRHYRYESSFKGDGRNFHLNAEYQCRLEGDPTAAFNQLEWRLQGGMNRLKLSGKLPDGSAFKVQPVHMDWRIWDKNAGICPDSTKTVDSEIWLTTAGSSPRIERFDANHVTAKDHQLQLIESKLALDKTDSVPPGTPGLKPPPYNEDRPQYYIVEMISVPAASASNQKGLKDFTEQKRIPWLAQDQSYPFTAWSDDDVTFARNYTSVFTTEDDRRGGPGRDAEGLKAYYATPANNAWLIDREHGDLASQWLQMPDRKDADKHVPRPDPAAMTKAWIVYDGARIEIPLFSYYRVLYDPKRDEYVQFSISRSDVD